LSKRTQFVFRTTHNFGFVPHNCATTFAPTRVRYSYEFWYKRLSTGHKLVNLPDTLYVF